MPRNRPRFNAVTSTSCRCVRETAGDHRRAVAGATVASAHDPEPQWAVGELVDSHLREACNVTYTQLDLFDVEVGEAQV